MQTGSYVTADLRKLSNVQRERLESAFEASFYETKKRQTVKNILEH